MPTPRWGYGATEINGKIFTIGGVRHKDGDGLSVVEVYEPEADTWQRYPNMPTARLTQTAEAVNGKIYVIGGVDNTQWIPPLATVEVYDPGFTSGVNPQGKHPTTWGEIKANR